MNEPVVGIDLGTSNSVLATVEDGRPMIIPSRNGGWLTPSMVAYHEGRYLVGKPARELLDWFPGRVATATKRFIGQRYSDELVAGVAGRLPYRLVRGTGEEIRVSLEGHTLPLTQVSALILGELYLDAQQYWGRKVRKAVITVPANFDDGQRQATKEAARIAGFELLRIVNEPTAAALAFGMARQFSGRALVFDLGGGTLDVTVLEVTEGVYEVRATGGHPQLGGEDFDGRIMSWLLDQVPAEQRSAVEHDPVAVRRLRTAAENAKQALTRLTTTRIEVPSLSAKKDGAPALSVELERRVFDELSEPLWQKSLEVTSQVLRDARLSERDIDAVLLVGGMTRVPRIRELLSQRFGREPESGVSPDEVVGLGAAIQASQIGSMEGETLLLDVAGHSLGVGFAGQRVRRLIAKNAPIPARAEQCFVPMSARQQEAVIPIYQGEGDLANQCTKLGEVRLTNLPVSNLPVADRADVPILVAFELATDGTLSVTAEQQNTGEVKSLKILARSELNEGELKALRAEHSERMAEQTKADRKKAFETFEAQLLEYHEALAGDEGAKWTESELEAVARLLAASRDALNANDWERVETLRRGLRRLMSAKASQSGIRRAP